MTGIAARSGASDNKATSTEEWTWLLIVAPYGRYFQFGAGPKISTALRPPKANEFDMA